MFHWSNTWTENFALKFFWLQLAFVANTVMLMSVDNKLSMKHRVTENFRWRYFRASSQLAVKYLSSKETCLTYHQTWRLKELFFRLCRLKDRNLGIRYFNPFLYLLIHFKHNFIGVIFFSEIKSGKIHVANGYAALDS